MKRNPNGFTFLQQGISFDDYIDDFVNASSDISETYAFKEASKKLFPEENVKKDENES